MSQSKWIQSGSCELQASGRDVNYNQSKSKTKKNMYEYLDNKVPSIFHFHWCDDARLKTSRYSRSRVQDLQDQLIPTDQNRRKSNAKSNAAPSRKQRKDWIPPPSPKQDQTKSKPPVKALTPTKLQRRDSNANQPQKKPSLPPASRSLREIVRSASKHQWLALVGFCYVNFVSNASITVLSSFFAQEAVYKHGTNDFMVGLIFGCYAIVNAAACPIFGYFTARAGAKNLVLCGLLLSGIMSFLFSQLWRFDGIPFVTMCFVVRALQAIGCSAYYVGATVIISEEWRKDLTFAIGLGETFTGIGMITGPILGGCLFEEGEKNGVGGFQLPFIVICFMMLLGFVFCYYAMDNVGDAAQDGSFLQLLRIPAVFATCLFIMIMWASMDFNMPSLGEHMQRNHLKSDPILVGFMFVILALVYTAAAPLVGLIVKDEVSGKVTMLSGGIIVAISFLLIGPSPIFYPVGLTKPTVTLISIAMATLGLGLGVALVPNFQVLLQSALTGGMPPGVSTAGLVGGVFNSVTFIGEFIGPFLGGALLEKTNKDFNLTSSIFAAVLFVVTCVVAGVYILEGSSSKETDTVEETNADCFLTNEQPPAYGTFNEP